MINVQRTQFSELIVHWDKPERMIHDKSKKSNIFVLKINGAVGCSETMV